MLSFRGAINTKDLYGAVPSVLSGGFALDKYLLTLGGTLYCRFDEASGNLINYGSDGNSATVSSATQGQPQIAGLGSYLYDGVDDYARFAHTDLPLTKALTSQAWAFLVNLSSLGESSLGAFRQWSTDSASRYLRCNPGDKLQTTIKTTGTNALAVTAASAITDILGNPAWVFMDYDDADTLGNGRVFRLWKGISGTLTALTLATNTAGTATVVTPSADLALGNSIVATRTFDGLIYAVVARAALWTTNEMQQMINLAGV